MFTCDRIKANASRFLVNMESGDSEGFAHFLIPKVMFHFRAVQRRRCVNRCHFMYFLFACKTQGALIIFARKTDGGTWKDNATMR